MAPTQKEEFKGDKGLASPQTRNSGYVPSDAWLERAVQMITDAEIRADIMKITERSECQ